MGIGKILSAIGFILGIISITSFFIMILGNHNGGWINLWKSPISSFVFWKYSLIIALIALILSITGSILEKKIFYLAFLISIISLVLPIVFVLLIFSNPISW